MPFILLLQAFALLASPTFGLPPLDPRPGLKHAVTVADEACWITNDPETGVGLPFTPLFNESDGISQTSWYTRRASLAAIYAAAGSFDHIWITSSNADSIPYYH